MNMQNTLLESLQWRYAVKKFDASRKISDADWNVLAESLRLAASSYGLQPWKFIQVKNPSIRDALKPASWGQGQVTDASHYVVLTSLKTITPEYIDQFIAFTAKTRGIGVESLKGYRDMIVENLVKGKQGLDIHAWTQRQAYIAMGNLLTAAALLKIDATPMEGLEPAKYDSILGLTPTPYSTVAAVALGYRHPEDKYQHAKKVRFDLDQIVTAMN
jgi:nitroreductase